MAPDPGFHSRLGAAAAEALGTALLVLAIVLAAALSSAPGSPVAGGLPGPGARFLVLGLPGTGASINPARSEGPAVAFGDLTDLWLYLLAPSAAGLTVGLAWRVTEARFAALLREP